MTTENYQNLVIGSGEAGKVLAWNLAKKGQKTAVVEEDDRRLLSECRLSAEQECHL